MSARIARRGDNIPPISDYAHWNEDAKRVWYEENRYDMEHADEPMDDDGDEDWSAQHPTRKGTDR
jgi:hypothetical protein